MCSIIIGNFTLEAEKNANLVIKQAITKEQETFVIACFIYVTQFYKRIIKFNIKQRYKLNI